MSDKFLFKLGYYSIYSRENKKTTKYIIDSGKTIYIERLKKYIINPYRDTKEFSSLEKAKEYIFIKLSEKKEEKQKRIEQIPKSLYLVLIREESTNNLFVKVGITSKRFLMRRFSKSYGYKGYNIETILRRIDTPIADKLEEEIKEKLNKKRSIKKYRPVLESFSGYSECYENLCLDEIIKIFDNCVNMSNK